MTALAELSKALRTLVNQVERDVNGINSMPGTSNGGLTSDETLRAAGKGRAVLYRHRTEIKQENAS